MDTKRKTMHLILFIIALVMPVSLLLQPLSYAKAYIKDDDPMIQILDSSKDGIKLQFLLPTLPEVEIITSEMGELFSKVNIPGSLVTDQPGDPALPYFAYQLGIPFGVEPSIEVQLEIIKTIDLAVPVFPAQKQINATSYPGLDIGDGLLSMQEESVFAKNEEVYSSNVAFPVNLAAILNDGALRSQRIVSLGIFPIQYLPEKHALSFAEKIIVTMSFEGEYQVEKSDSISEPFDSVLAANLLNYEDAIAWRSQSAGLASIDKESILSNTWVPPNLSWRILTQKDGMHQVTFSELEAAGFPVDGVNPEYLKMFNQGDEIAIELILADPNVFQTGDAIRFYATSIDQKYTNRNVYWLAIDTSPGLRIETWDASPEEITPLTEFQITRKFAEKKWFDALIPGDGDTDRFFWGLIYRSGQTIVPNTSTFTLPDYNDGEATMKLTLIGRSQSLEVNPDHHLSATINGTIISPDLYFDGNNWKDFTLTIPAGILVSGNNSLSLTPVLEDGYDLDVVYLHSFEIDYTADSIATNNQFRFDYSDDEATFKVTGFSNDSILVYEVSDPMQPQKAVNTQIDPLGENFSITFGDSEIEDGSYQVLTTTELAVPVLVEKDTLSDLLNPDNIADYIIISHNDFIAEAERFAIHKRSMGYQTMVVDVQDIYDQFSDGILDPYAIKRFLGYAYANWADPKPAYVLLVGDGTNDPKQYLSGSQATYIPPMLINVDTKIGETPADNRFVQIVGDDLIPDMLIGRASANTVEEAAAVFDKTIDYETNPPEGDWKKRYVTIADDMEPGKYFAGFAELYISQYLQNKGLDINRIYWLETHFDLNETRQAIQDSFSDGALLINYIGHAYYGGWAEASPGQYLFTLKHHFPLVSETTKLPVVLSLACNDGFFASRDANSSAMGEVLTRTPDKGAVAMWAASGFGDIVGHDALAKGFLDSMFNRNEQMVGKSVLSGLLLLWSTGYNYDQMDNYIYFGDPTLQLAREMHYLYLPEISKP